MSWILLEKSNQEKRRHKGMGRKGLLSLYSAFHFIPVSLMTQYRQLKRTIFSSGLFSPQVKDNSWQLKQ